MSYVQTRLNDKVFEIVLNRPEKRNAFGSEMIQQLTEAFSQAGLNKDIRVVYLYGEGPSFCAGADLEWMKSMVNFSEKENKEDSEKLFEMFEAAQLCMKPIITRVQGHVMGGALGLLAVSDIVVADDSTIFAFSEVKLGLAPAVISHFVLPRMVPQWSQRFMLTGEHFDAHIAKEAGLVSFVGGEEQCRDQVKSLICDFYKNGPEAVSETKKLLAYVRSRPSEDNKSATAKVIAKRRVSEEGQAGLNGFLNKQEISWKLDY